MGYQPTHALPLRFPLARNRAARELQSTNREPRRQPDIGRQKNLRRIPAGAQLLAVLQKRQRLEQVEVRRAGAAATAARAPNCRSAARRSARCEPLMAGIILSGSRMFFRG